MTYLILKKKPVRILFSLLTRIEIEIIVLMHEQNSEGLTAFNDTPLQF